MRYTLYLRTGSGDAFLQKSPTLEGLKKSQQTVQLWLGQMSVEVPDPQTAMLVIADGSLVLFEARYMAGGRRVWRPVDPKNQTIRASFKAI